MSIINEALKKTAQAASLAHKPFKSKPFLFYILILLAGLLSGNFIFNLLAPKTQTKQTPQENANTMMQTPKPPPLPILLSQPPEEKKPAETNFVLNGIFFSAHDSYALINNQIVKENDHVAGAKVGLITADSVQLDNQGKIITLTSAR